MRIHREGRDILLGTLVALIIVHFIIGRYSAVSHRNYQLFTALNILFYAWLLYFFRDPNRIIPQHPQGILSPADGKVVLVQEVNEDEYLHERRIQIGVFMSPLNVHVNRSPVSGTVKYVKYHPGKYLVAWHPKSSTKNERTTIVVENTQGVQVLFRQIAGFVARRIRFYPQEGDHIQQGNEYGFIKFGSRADIFLPLDAKIQVKLGDKVKGGVSVLATL